MPQRTLSSRSTRSQKRTSGFLKRSSTQKGRAVLQNRRRKGRARLSI